MGWQTVSVFISSTFKDMHSERDILVKRAFPLLRERLLPYRIRLVDIDLRWGITEDQAENDETIDFCLASIENCRPFFLGILGERYGWIPEKSPKATHVSFPEKMSITAMEIFHGVLNENAGAGKPADALGRLASGFSGKQNGKSTALFFFRNPGFEKTMPEDLRSIVAAESPEHHRKQKALKEKIRNYPLKIKPVENYNCNFKGLSIDWTLLEDEAPAKVKELLGGHAAGGIIEAGFYETLPEDVKQWLRAHATVLLDGLEEFAGKVVEDLWTVLCEEFPELHQPPRASENREMLEDDAHLKFLEEITALFVGREPLLKEIAAGLDAEKVTKPIILAGSTGSGRSALLGQVVKNWQKANPEGATLVHFAGASVAGNQPEYFFARIFRLLKAVSPETTPEDDLLPEFVTEDIRQLLENIPAGKNVLIAIDDPDIIFGDQGLDLRWIPDVLPGHVKIVMTLSDDQTFSALNFHQMKQLDAAFYQIPVLRKEERKTFIRQLPALSAKTMDPRHIDLLSGHPSSNLPLFLSVALEELRMFGSYERLEKRIRRFPDKTGKAGLEAVYFQMLQRLEKEIGTETVVRPLALLATSVTGLKETEVGQLCPDVPDEKLALLWRELRIHLQTKEGRLNFYHASLRNTVRKHYLANPDRKKQYHADLAAFFSDHPDKDRALRELPEHYYRCDEPDKMQQLLAQPGHFLHMRRKMPEQLASWWDKAGISDPLDMLHKVVCEQFDAYGDILKNDQGVALKFWAPVDGEEDIKVYNAESFQSLNPRLTSAEQDVLLELVRLADRRRVQNDSAFLIRLKTLALFEQEFGPVHARTLEALASALPFILRQLEPEAGNKYLTKILINASAYLPQRHPVFITLMMHAQRFLNTTDKSLDKLNEEFNELMGFFENDESVENLLELPRDIPHRKKQLLQLQSQILLNHSQELRMGGFIDEAQQLCKRAVTFTEENLGPFHELSILAQNNLAGIYMDNLGDFAAGEKILKETLQRADTRVGKNSELGLTLVNNLSVMYGNAGKYEEGLPYYEEALARKQAAYGENHQSTLHSRYNLAYCLMQLGEYEKAVQHCRAAADGFGKLGDSFANDRITIMIHLSDMLKKAGKQDEAEKVFADAYRAFENLNEQQKKWRTYYTLTTRKAKNHLDIGEPEEAVKIYWEQLENLLYIEDAVKYVDQIFLELKNHLTILLNQEKENQNAEAVQALTRELIKLHRIVLGDDHPDTLHWQSQLGELLIAYGRPEEAEPLLRELVAQLKKIKGSEDPQTRIATAQLADALGKLGKEEEAGELLMASIKAGANRKTDTETLCREIVEKSEKENGEAHPKTLQTLDEAGDELLGENKIEAALKYFTTAFERSEKAYGPLAVETLKRARKLADIYLKMNDFTRAEPMLRRVADFFEQQDGLSSTDTVRALEDLRNALTQMEEFAEAIAVNEKIIEAKKTIYGEGDLLTVESISRMPDLYERANEREKFTAATNQLIEKLKPLCAPEAVRALAMRYRENAGTLRKNRIAANVNQIKKLQKEGKLEYLGSDPQQLEEAAESMSQGSVDQEHPEGAGEIEMLTAILQRLKPYRTVVELWGMFCEHLENNVKPDDPAGPVPRFGFAQWLIDFAFFSESAEQLIKIWSDQNLQLYFTQRAARLLFNVIAFDGNVEDTARIAGQMIPALTEVNDIRLPEIQYFKNQAAAFFMLVQKYPEAATLYAEILEQQPAGKGGHLYFFNEIKIRLGKTLAKTGKVNEGIELCREAWDFFSGDEQNRLFFAYLASSMADVLELSEEAYDVNEFRRFAVQYAGVHFERMVNGALKHEDTLQQLLVIDDIASAAEKIKDFAALNNALSVQAIGQKRIGHIANMNETLWRVVGNFDKLEQKSIESSLPFVVNMWEQTGQQEMIEKLKAILDG